MSELNRVHAKAVILYICFPLFFVLAWLISAYLLQVFIPPNIIVGISLLSFLITAKMRVDVWIKRESLLNEDERKTLHVRIFFLIIPIELLISLLGICFLFM